METELQALEDIGLDVDNEVAGSGYDGSTVAVGYASHEGFGIQDDGCVNDLEGVETDDEHDDEEDDDDDVHVEEDVENEDVVGYVGYDNEGCYGEDPIIINGLDDIYSFDFESLTFAILERLEFVDLEVAYEFYSWYARLSGFSVRKSNVVRDKKDETLQQTFVCSREGFRKNGGLSLQLRKRKAKNLTRCGCEALFRVHVHVGTGRWYVTVFHFDHKHEMLEGKLCALLPAHRKMSAIDIIEIENYRKVGIRPPHMYAAFANSSGGYENVRFVRKDIYNQVERQRRQHKSDVQGALMYLRELGSKDPMMYVSYTVDADNRLQHLFWCDGESQMNYVVFGDVLAFDATYKKNKYLCPFVVLSGVNHHNQTIVFATALVTNETEETYVWLLEQFLEAMKGKAPCSVITDGDVAMKNAIRRVFPNTHHRLCAWHLLRNATSNLKNPAIMPFLKKLMLGDIDVGEFEEKWNEMLSTFGLEDNTWVVELYEKKRMWSPAHIRGNFFAGIRTTSRCEALHAHIGKYVDSRTNLTDFVQQFHRCLTYFRYREVEADYHSNYGDVYLETNFHAIERFAGRRLTKEMFLSFQSSLKKTGMFRVVECQEMTMYCVYTILKYRTGAVWHVSYCPSKCEMRCSCLRMESIGLPCIHILTVMVNLDFNYIPECLILDRWTKLAKEGIRGTYLDGSIYWDSHLIARYARLVHLSRQVFQYAHREDEEYDHWVQLLTGELTRLKLKNTNDDAVEVANTETEQMTDTVLDPPRVRHKGCGAAESSQTGGRRRQQACGNCGQMGHNRRSCTEPSQTQVIGSSNVPAVE